MNESPLSLAQFAQISAFLDVGLTPEVVLPQLGLDSEGWALEQRRWLEEIGREMAAERFDLQQEYTQLFYQFRKLATDQLQAMQGPPCVNRETPVPAYPGEPLHGDSLGAAEVDPGAWRSTTEPLLAVPNLAQLAPLSQEDPHSAAASSTPQSSARRVSTLVMAESVPGPAARNGYGNSTPASSARNYGTVPLAEVPGPVSAGPSTPVFPPTVVGADASELGASESRLSPPEAVSAWDPYGNAYHSVPAAHSPGGAFGEPSPTYAYIASTPSAPSPSLQQASVYATPQEPAMAPFSYSNTASGSPEVAWPQTMTPGGGGAPDPSPVHELVPPKSEDEELQGRSTNLSIEHVAYLSALVRRESGRSLETLARYGFNGPSFLAETEAWSERLATDPVAFRRYEALVEFYSSRRR